MVGEILSSENLSTNEKLIELLCNDKTGMLIFNLDNLKTIISTINLDGKMYIASKSEGRENIIAYKSIESLERLTNMECVQKQVEEQFNQLRNIKLSAYKLKNQLTNHFNNMCENGELVYDKKIVLDIIDFVCNQNELIIVDYGNYKKSIIIADSENKEVSDKSDLHLQIVETEHNDKENVSHPIQSEDFVLRVINKYADEKLKQRLIKEKKLLNNEKEQRNSLINNLRETYMENYTK